ncbi:MAG TPA: hypothetical protein VJN21_02730 [Candidatus Acidoferrales bacterium]|nr:hypothetical protein [Candidatus Acidoferrales bacterium]
MKRLHSFMLVLIVVNWILVLGHLILVEKMLPGPEFKVSWAGVATITFINLIVLIVATALWRLSDKWAGGVLALFWTAALIAGVYEHFLQLAPNNVFRAPSGDWTGLFDASVFALLVVEVAGLWLAVRLLGSGQNLKLHES